MQKENTTKKGGNFDQPIVSRREICPTHKQIKLGYLAWFDEAEKRAKKGMKQKQCKECGYWLWKDEM